MKGIEGNTSEPIMPPKVTLFEKTPKNTEERVCDAIYDMNIHDPDPRRTDPRVINDDFEKASKLIVGNRELEALIVMALHNNDSSVIYASLMNELTKACISLSDTNIDNLIGKFKQIFSTHLNDYVQMFKLNDADIERMHSSINTDSLARGIKPVVHFIRNRKNAHEKSSDIISAFYLESHLDAYHGVDLIEIIEGENGVSLNLVQIKAHEFTEEEINKYTEAHEKWARDYTVDMESYENNFSHEPDSEGVNLFKENVKNIKNIIIDILTSGDIPKKTLYDDLGIGKFEKAEQLWILERYLPVFKNNIDQMVADGDFQGDEEHVETLFSLLSDLNKQLNEAMSYKKNIKGIHEIHSICATEVFDKKKGYERSDVVVFRNNGPKRKVAKMIH